MKLLDETELPMTEIADAAGFGSVRRFNELIRSTYQRTPRSLRRRSASPAGGGGLRLRLAYRPPLDWRWLRDFLALRAVPGLEEVEGERYRRVIALEGRRGWIEVGPVAGSHALELTVAFPDVARLATIVARARSAFDLDADPMTIERDLGADPRLAERLALRPGLRVPGAWDGFELAVRAVLGQGVSVAAARTLATRLVLRFGVAFGDRPRGGLTHSFPGADTLAEADLAEIGLPGSRAGAIRALARSVLEGRIELAGAGDFESLTSSLQSLPGVGPWTAQYVAMRAGGHPDAFPCEDLGLLRGAAACLGRSGASLTAGALHRYAERWRPWRAYAAMHLWAAHGELRAPARDRGRSAKARSSAGSAR
jgi:AraC family transcriptional regulator of adaptative response / DNA-3-methyladenine glycosylase II